MEKRIAICPGSFDPITKGPVSYTHLDVYKRQIEYIVKGELRI